MKNDRFKEFTDDNGQSYYCPLDAFGGNNRLIDELADDCIETDVVQRYSGNLHILRS